ncbi:MAG: 50S ribosomal protein L25 [Nitrospinae bacterium]|nr:50S ribosomal protein L25 [Nitrospinota bacterium]
MSEFVLEGKTRAPGRKGPARRIRAQGMVPGVIYGGGTSLTMAVEAKKLLKILETKGGKNSVITTRLEGDARERTVMIKELTAHPIYDTLLHVDLLEIDTRKPIRVTVPLEFTGVAKGVKDKGGRLKHALRALRVECLPSDIPAAIQIDVTEMDIGTVWRVRDLPLDNKLKALNDPEVNVVSCAIPKVEKEPTPAEAAAAGAAPAAAAEGAAPADKAEKGEKDDKGGKAEKGGKK